MHADDTNYTVIKNGVVVVSGTGPAIRVDGNRIVIRDGPKETPPLALTRAEASRRLRHIIVTGHAGGFVTFDALRWLRDTGVALSQVDWDGRVILASGPLGTDQPTLRRAQAVVCSGFVPNAGVAIAREILRIKLKGQAEVARLSGWVGASAAIKDLAETLADETTGAKMLTIEARAAAVYWKEWEHVQVTFARRNPPRLDSSGRWRPGRAETWHEFGSRASVLTGKSLKAATPGNAILNYLYALARTEMTRALLAAGLDPGIGIFHLDLENRPSLALDAIEAARPYVDAWLLAYLGSSAFANRDFYELEDGEIRLTHPLTPQLGHTTAHWRNVCEPIAAWLAQAFGRFAPLIARSSADAFGQIHPAPARRRLIDCNPAPTIPALLPPIPAFLGPARGHIQRRNVLRLKGGLRDDPTPRACFECGRALQWQQRKFCSAACAKVFARETDHLVTLSAVLPEVSRLRRAEKLQKSLAARRAWGAARAGATGHLPPIHVAENAALVQWYANELKPYLSSVRPVDIARALDVSQGYSIRIKHGYMPHPRHFAALAKLAGIEVPKALLPQTTAAASLPALQTDDAE
jgi:CRISPR-associated endonuclease Cas1